jgi:iron complex transport system substrate-binding protein
VSRFRTWAAVAAVVVVWATAGCGSGASSADSEAQGPWSYTDASGNTVSLDNTPQRIIASAGAAAALMSFGIRPVGLYADVPVADDPNLEGLDLAGITILGETWGVIDVELAATLRPDLIVADWWPVERAYSGMEEGVEEESKRIADLAPVVGSAQGDSIVTLIEGYEELAVSLGADLDESAVAQSRQDFETAVGEFEEAVAAKPGLTALAVSPTTDLLYVAVPEHAPELLDFQQWGLDVTVPDSPDPGFPYWENLSWESADKYQPDLLLIDDRGYPDNLETAEQQPTWQRIRAAEAGAVIPWPAYWLHTYSAYAEQLGALTDAINGADPDLGS